MTTESELTQLRVEAETGLASIGFVDPAALDRIAAMVSSDDFVDHDLGNVFQIVTDLREAGRTVESKAVLVEAKQRGIIAKLTSGYIAKIVNAGYAPANVEHYALTVARLAKNRRLMAAARALLAREHDTGVEPAELLNRFEAATDGLLSEHNAGFVPFADAVVETITEHRKAINSESKLGFPTGFPSLDSIIGGFYPGQLVLLGGRTFAGKTALALAFASYFATRERSTWFVSLEMTRQELAERLLADDCGFELRQFTQTGLSAEALDSIENSLDEYRRWPLVITDCPHESVKTIRAKAKLQKARGLNMVVVDNLQLIAPADYREPRRIQLEAIARDLKWLAKELNCVVLLLCQLNADAEGNEPDDRHYAESKQILAHADVAMLAHRADKADSDFLLKITKNRRGKPDRLTLIFDGAYQRFTDPSLVDLY